MDKKIIQIARVSLSGKDDKVFPLSQIEAYGQAADAMVIWPYGIHGSLPVDSYAISFSINGQQEYRAIIGFKPDIRLKNLKPGEFVVGNFVKSSTVFFDEDGNIIINCEKDQIVTIKGDATVNIEGEANITVTGNTTITTPKLTIDGDLEVTGSTTLSDTVTSNGVDISDTHPHSGVTTGASNTGPPV